MKNVLIACGIVFALSAPSSLFADTFFNFSFNTVLVHGQPGYPYNASGQFDTIAATTPGTFTIVGTTGTVNGSLLFEPSAITSFSGGTLFSSTGSISLDGVDIFFNDGEIQLVAGNYPNIGLATGYLAYLNFYASPILAASEVASVNLAITHAPDVIAATPEPSTLVLLGTGGLGLLEAARRRLRQASDRRQPTLTTMRLS